MTIGPTQTLVNLVLQVALVVGAISGAYLGRRRRFRRHCLAMRILMAVQILAIALVMAPSLAAYVNNWTGLSWLRAEIIIHAVFGIVLIGLWSFINLALLGIVKTPRHLRRFMWAALAVWLVSLALGIHLYTSIWA
ncbi:MAG: hypothetical protein A2W26_04365 [Acidobacteria bacterium RBG_16_64_8]|nr:MAG: hypothetical protein A2W26_04365 [Acidobacteria bacterium RBG_16_64_8]